VIQTETKTATRLNWSTLRHLAVSAKLLKWRVEHPQTDTLDMRLGRAIHCAILEPEAYPKRWIVAGPCAATKKDGGVCGSQGSLYLDGDWFCRVRGHGPEGSGPLPEGVEVLTEADVETVKISAAAVAEHKLAAKTLSGGLPEHEIEWTEPETGIACRGRIDYLRPSQVVDLKSTIEETVRAFERTVANRMYHAQLAWYHDGAVHAGGSSRTRHFRSSSRSRRSSRTTSSSTSSQSTRTKRARSSIAICCSATATASPPTTGQGSRPPWSSWSCPSGRLE
jgi:hypothetical protein